MTLGDLPDGVRPQKTALPDFLLKIQHLNMQSFKHPFIQTTYMLAKGL